jgi:hypothetical protein
MAVDLKFILGIIGNIVFFFFSTLLCLIYLFLMKICLLRCFFLFCNDFISISFLAAGGRYDNMRSAGSMDPLIAHMHGSFSAK